MVFYTTNLFKGVRCPERNCQILNCIFGHHEDEHVVQEEKGSERNHVPTRNSPTTSPKTVCQGVVGILNSGSKSSCTYTKAQPEEDPSAAQRLPSTNQEVTEKISPLPSSHPEAPPAKRRKISSTGSDAVNATSNDVVTPRSNLLGPNKSSQTSLGNGKKESKSAAKADPERLVPRRVPIDPVPFSKRLLYLQHLHAEMARLNSLSPKGGLIPKQQTIKMALNEEERLALEKGSVYANVLKLRISAYKKMKFPDWESHVKSLRTDKTTNPKPRDTGVSPSEELSIARTLVVTDQSALAKHGYIPTPPNEAAAQEAAAAVLASKNYEICERCAARFQVFPDRDASGRLTSNGPCRYHPLRKVQPMPSKADTGPREASYPCCGQTVGNDGCTTAEWHVFKASSPARLAAVLPFVNTPEIDNALQDAQGKPVDAIVFDCEMGFTTLGMELIRITALSWPGGDVLIDALVRPFGIILDLNSRFSGVWPQQFANAVEIEAADIRPSPKIRLAVEGAQSRPSSKTLPMLKSPLAARAALLAYATPKTILIGHAIENDLNAIRLCHPLIIDTVLLFPHPKGLPMRCGLRALAEKFLGKIIQSGEGGHDAAEDAQVTGELVRAEVGKRARLGLKEKQVKAAKAKA
ncbi:hypothetical protein K470DRAFT_259850 [Piedraia hortae CBS 480.64]|uniref:Exonuclease domain-containing protein n=1 Tax=Piedraia hortae CBS 480.64 TaxID=1314780 RepID=A0A6A7BVC0_9PEZI|nr:hypothetical protein K470DRAFT_259850 [Piedraia hortae CBS 480.64]